MKFQARLSRLIFTCCEWQWSIVFYQLLIAIEPGFWELQQTDRFCGRFNSLTPTANTDRALTTVDTEPGETKQRNADILAYLAAAVRLVLAAPLAKALDAPQLSSGLRSLAQFDMSA
ncbi:hypothetical protein [Mesorhizobium sp. M1365]|uniref:hypothetical protein n=1 Tax=Mesorhizobium sp. M1365 TaxID=2957090 RepID=UPI0033375589